MRSSKSSTTKGFTIVELLIVIVVIGILAAIVIVAYNGVQSGARDARRTSDVKNLQRLVEEYKVDNGNYPIPPGGNQDVGYNFTDMTSYFVPKYTNSIPLDPTGVSYQYVRGSVANDSYGIRVMYESKPRCHVGNNDGPTNWWGYPSC